MPRVMNRTEFLVPFACSNCATTLGYTAEGEAQTMDRRALHYCERCVKAKPGLTERQQEAIRVAAILRRKHDRAPLFDEIAAELGVARSRVSALARSIRERGHGEAWEEALFGPMEKKKAKVVPHD